MVCAGRVTALAVSPDGKYCVGAIAEKLHVWQVCILYLLLVLSFMNCYSWSVCLQAHVSSRRYAEYLQHGGDSYCNRITSLYDMDVIID